MLSHAKVKKFRGNIGIEIDTEVFRGSKLTKTALNLQADIQSHAVEKFKKIMQLDNISP